MPIRHAGKNRMVLAAVLGMVLGWGGMAETASAALITFNFAGNVNAVGDPINSDFHVGDTFQGSYSFNSPTADHNLRSDVGVYTLANGMFSVSGKSYAMGEGEQPGILLFSVIPSPAEMDSRTPIRLHLQLRDLVWRMAPFPPVRLALHSPA
jgi:hypothetical protein